jgi:hypothetical protein
MSFEAFMNDPKGYCAIHEIQLFGAGDNLVPAAVTRVAPPRSLRRREYA